MIEQRLPQMNKHSFESFFAPLQKALAMTSSDAVTDLEATELPEAATSHAFAPPVADIAFEKVDHFHSGADHDDHDHDGIWLAPSDDEQSLFSGAEGRPDHAGGGGNGGGKGGGKVKDGTDGSPTDGTTTDTGGTTTDTGGTTTDTGGTTTDTGGTSTGGGTTTTDTGSATFGWLDDTTYVSGAETPDGFNIELKFHGEWTDYQKSVAVAQAELLSETVIGDMPGSGGIDDIRINFYNGYVDGAGGAWGHGGWMQVRADGTALEGGLELDDADLGTAESMGMLDELMLHEMLHAMGFGTTWNSNGLVANNEFIGENAMDVYGGAVPLDSTGNHLLDSGATEGVMGSTYFGPGETLTDLTLAILEDMGYETIYPDEPEEIAALVV